MGRPIERAQLSLPTRTGRIRQQLTRIFVYIRSVVVVVVNSRQLLFGFSSRTDTLNNVSLYDIIYFSETS